MSKRRDKKLAKRALAREKRKQQKIAHVANLIGPNGEANGGDIRGAGYKVIIRENQLLEDYYKIQPILPAEEWDEFMRVLKKNLPSTFRIAGYKNQAAALLEIIQSRYFTGLVIKPDEAEAIGNGKDEHNTKEDKAQAEQKKCNDDEDLILRPEPIIWYPDNLAWNLNLPRTVIRRHEQFAKLHNFLISETESGNITRQEAVSMIPPIALDIKSHHKVIDLCAAPGSKTAQIIELLHSEEGKMPEGCVVANDVDNKRCYMLVHQAKRMQSPCVLITNHDGGAFPNFMLPDADGKQQVMKFDRVLCDVPCSGDGTLRKNPDAWLKWSPGNGNNHHGIQIRILRRGAEIMSIGGRLVYSTCSFNPVEDEAVICRMLKEAEGSLHLVDVRERFPGLKCKPGVSEWTPMNSNGEAYKTVQDVPGKWLSQIHEDLFPPPPDVAKGYHLEKCIRIFPHDQNTGGFFIAVLEKSKALPWERQRSPDTTAQSTATETIEDTEKPEDVSKPHPDTGRPPPAKKRRLGYREDPYVFFEKGEEIWSEIKDFFQISGDIEESQLFTRSKEGKKKNIYLVNKLASQIVRHNESKVKIVNTGIRSFVRCDQKHSSCNFRLTQEGIPILMPVMSSRYGTVDNVADLTALLGSDKVDLETTTMYEAMLAVETGSFVVTYEKQLESGHTLKIQLVGWKGQHSIRAYLPKHDRLHFLHLIGGDTSKLERNKFQDKADREAKNAAQEGEKEGEGEKDEETETVDEDDAIDGDNTESIEDKEG